MANKGPRVPFRQAAERLLLPCYDESKSIGAGSSLLPTLKVPALGYLKGVWLWVTTSGGNGAALKPDAPWSILDQVRLLDVSNNPIVSLSGWRLYLANRNFGYQWHGNPVDDAGYDSTAANPGFWLWVPAEARSRDAYAALPSGNASQPIKIEVTLAPESRVWQATPTNLPTVRVRGYASMYSQPAGTDPVTGMAQETRPDAFGTVSLLTTERTEVGAGDLQYQLETTPGRLVRGLIIEGRTAAGARSNSVLPTELEVWRNNFGLIRGPRELYWTVEGRDTPRAISAIDRPAGVAVISFANDLDQHTGDEVGADYLRLSTGDFLELRGQVGTAGSLTVIAAVISPASGMTGDEK